MIKIIYLDSMTWHLTIVMNCIIDPYEVKCQTSSLILAPPLDDDYRLHDWMLCIGNIFIPMENIKTQGVYGLL